MDLGVLAHAASETVKICVPTLIEARRGKVDHALYDERLRRWSDRILKRVNAHVIVNGLQHLNGEAGPFVVVSNHQSHYDIPVLYVSLPLSLRMAGKKELFKTPIWGPALRTAGFVEIDRSNPKNAYEALRRAGDAMREHRVSLFVAPEGTRSSDGVVASFKKGAFDTARTIGVPILPVAISGTRGIHAKGESWVQRGCDVRVQVLPPIQPADFRQPEEMSLLVREQIVAALRP